MKYEDQYETIKEAANLLNAPLVWSYDLDVLRYHLACILECIAEGADPEPAAQDLAKALTDEFHAGAIG